MRFVDQSNLQHREPTMRTSVSNCSVPFFSTKDSASSKAVIKTRLRPGVEQGFSFMAREDVTAIVRSTPPYS